jgi:hypothetical protein
MISFSRYLKIYGLVRNYANRTQSPMRSRTVPGPTFWPLSFLPKGETQHLFGRLGLVRPANPEALLLAETDLLVSRFAADREGLPHPIMVDRSRINGVTTISYQMHAISAMKSRRSKFGSLILVPFLVQTLVFSVDDLQRVSTEIPS